MDSISDPVSGRYLGLGKVFSFVVYFYCYKNPRLPVLSEKRVDLLHVRFNFAKNQL